VSKLHSGVCGNHARFDTHACLINTHSFIFNHTHACEIDTSWGTQILPLWVSSRHANSYCVNTLKECLIMKIDGKMHCLQWFNEFFLLKNKIFQKFIRLPKKNFGQHKKTRISWYWYWVVYQIKLPSCKDFDESWVHSCRNAQRMTQG
jgi:hypothetical protein